MRVSADRVSQKALFAWNIYGKSGMEKTEKRTRETLFSESEISFCEKSFTPE
jgi:hypothetical protein